jgi:ATP-dependent DNA helicase RecG
MIGFYTDAGIVEKLDLNEAQVKIVELIRANPKISAKSIANEIGIAPRNVQVYIQTLKQAGMLERAGLTKGGRWVLK